VQKRAPLPALAIVAAVADNGVIGRDNRLIWRLKTDLRRFRDLTWGKPMIMGRKTFESIGKPLPGRRTIVLTRDRGFAEAGVEAVHSWDEAVARAGALACETGAEEIAVIGGAEIYALALPHTRRLYLTLVHATPQGDAVFPPYDRAAFRELRRSEVSKGPDDEHRFTFVDLERRSADAGR
jgi:dihydrofolate reductase